MNQISGVAAAISILRDAYPRADFPERTAALYATMLADLDDLLAVEAVKRLIRRSSFLPSIAEIRQEVAEAVLQLPSPADAWAMVNELDAEGIPTIVSSVLHAMGGRWALRTTENVGIFRAQFLSMYGGRREQALREFMGAIAHGPTMAALPVSESIRPREIEG